MRKATGKHAWTFAPRFRRGAFGWRSDPALTRIRDALAEIKAINRKDPHANRLQVGRRTQEQRGSASMAEPHLMHSFSVRTAGVLNPRTSSMDSRKPDLAVMTTASHGSRNSAHAAITFPEM
jgi:hypothetical protein